MQHAACAGGKWYLRQSVGDLCLQHCNIILCADARYHIRKQQGKSVAVVTAHGVTHTQDGPQKVAYLAQNFVAGIEPNTLIDAAEAAHIKDEDSETLARA